MASELEQVQRWECHRDFPGVRQLKGGTWILRDLAIAAAEKDNAAAEQRGVQAGRMAAFEGMRAHMAVLCPMLVQDYSKAGHGTEYVQGICIALATVANEAEAMRDEAAKENNE